MDFRLHGSHRSHGSYHMDDSPALEPASQRGLAEASAAPDPFR
jgi:hypothetical protein